MLVQEFLEKSAARSPHKEALVCGSTRLTYGEIDRAANQLAHTLQACGVRYGDRVAVLIDNSPETVISIWAILKADATFLVINPTTKSQKIAYILNNCRATALLTHVSRWKSALPAANQTGSLRTVVLAGKVTPRIEESVRPGLKFLTWEEAGQGKPAEAPERKAIDIDLAALIYTSGTTGNPKGVMLTHLNIVSASTSITTYLENVENDIIINILPLSFDYGLYQILMAAQFGGKIILDRSFAYPYAIIKLIQEEKVTGFPLVPTISAILLQMKELEKEEFKHLRYLTNTAAALPVSHITGLGKVFPRATIYSMYGLTECKRVSYLPPEELKRRPTSVGKGMPNEQVYLVDEKDQIITDPGVVGELVVRGSNLMKGYWELPAETAERLKPGLFPWEQSLYTGDLFRMDEEGFLYFVSRKDDIIKSRGEKVSPREVENAIYALEDVLETAVVGVPDEVLGEAIKAYVVLKEGSTLTENDILLHCSKNLEDFMIPQLVEFKESLPKTSTGKITTKNL
ncbi:MAG: AMP-binding protein [Candidatus Krumholzibacteriota bacterium]|nr:AMP-binding protein [Candidatus Krumholzibacteriota bacterium]